MIVKVNFKVGENNYQLELDEKNEMEGLHKAIVLSTPPRVCDNCNNSANFRLVSNKDKEGNTYVNVKCGECQACAKLGQYKAGGYFWHRFELYKPKTQREEKDN